MTTTNLGLTKPVVNGDTDAWGDEWNTNADLIDAAFNKSTPTLTDGSGAGLTLTITAAKSGKVGPFLAFIAFNISWPPTSNTAAVVISGNPIQPATGMYIPALCHSSAAPYQNAPIIARVIPGTGNIEILNAQTNANITNAQLSTGFVRACIVYPV